MTARRSIVGMLAGASAVPVLGIGLALTAALSVGAGASGSSGRVSAAGDIPSGFLELYQAAAEHYELGADGWAYLAGVGKVECDHGRSTAYGCDRGEANSAGARGPAQFLLPTWEAYGVDANRDGRRDLYDPVDAVFGMANYLRASGAPADWDRALFAYNHSSAYVADVKEWAARYLAAAAPAEPVLVTQPIGGAWLIPIPSFPAIRCDSRIVADVEALVRIYGITVTACHGGPPHTINGEHPLGLAIDIVPSDGDWSRTMRLAVTAGWSPDCAAVGCPGRGPFRVVLYNGFPGHGDPAHTDIPHLHLSWDHSPAAPFTRADWVKTLLPAPMTTSRPCPGGRSKTTSRRRGAGRNCRA